MSDYLIVVVNRSLARFFTLEPVEFPQLESGPRLEECGEMSNPGIMDAQRLFTDSKPGRGAAPGGAVHGYDDHRDQYLDDLRRRFATKVAEEIRRLAKNKGVRRIILVSSAGMRQFLYPDLERLAHQEDYRIFRLSKNMINFTPQKIHAYLAEEGMIPERKMV